MHWSTSARRSRALLLFAVMAFIAASCSGSSDSGSGKGEKKEPTPFKEATIGRVSFVSSDGSAFADSQAVFTLTDTKANATYTVPVTGAGADTKTDTAVPAGTYRVSTSAEPQVSRNGSYTVRDVNPTEVTVAASTTPAAPGPVVQYGLDVQTVPVELGLGDITGSQVDLTWTAKGGAQVASYQLRQTTGSDAATSPTDGDEVKLDQPTATSASANGLEPGKQYTFTLFSTGSTGEALETQSISATTPSTDGKIPAFSLAPNTIVVDDMKALEPEPLGRGLVSVTLGPDNSDRSSSSAVPGIDPKALDSGCVVGQPLLVDTKVAGEDAFYGVIASCGGRPAGWRSTDKSAPDEAAVVDTNVPLAAVIPHEKIKEAEFHSCFNDKGKEVSAGGDGPCQGADTDGDGVDDTTEGALGFDPKNPADDWKSRVAAETTTPTGPPTTAPPTTAPPKVPSSKVEVTLTWSSGDALDLITLNPVGIPVGGSVVSGGGGRVDHVDAGDPSCGSTATRTATIVYDEGQPGSYEANVGFSEAPGTGYSCVPNPPFTVEVRVDGAVVQKYTGNGSGSYRFRVGPSTSKPPGFRTPGMGATGDQPSNAAAPDLQSKLPFSCKGKAGGSFNLNFGYGTFHDVDVDLDLDKFSWDIKAGVSAHIDPKLSLEASYECSLDVDGATFQLSTYPVPVNLEITPVLTGAASGKFELKGPRLELSFGVETHGKVDPTLETCGWLNIPCGVSVDTSVSAKPIGKFTAGNAELKAEGELSVGVGAEANLGVGIKNRFVTSKTGFALTMKPLVGKFALADRIGVGPSSGVETLGAPYQSQDEVDEIWNAQYEKGTPTITEKVAIGRASFNHDSSLVGPIDDTNGQCLRGNQPRTGNYSFPLLSNAELEKQASEQKPVGVRGADGKVREGGTAPMVSLRGSAAACPDGLCMDTGIGVPILTYEDKCGSVRCYFGDIGARVESKEPGTIVCPQTNDDDGLLTTAGVPKGTKFGANAGICAKLSVGGALGVDFVAETFVLGWGKKKSYPLWEKDFEYGALPFGVGTCPKDD